MIEVMDRGIGKLLAELDELQLTEKTIVIFTSDNGPDPLTGTRFNGKLRGTKYEIYEGGIRVPLFVRWPGRFTAGNRDQLVHFVDFLPTILELCGIKQPGQLALDGVSFRDVLLDEAQQQSPSRFWQWNRGQPNYSHNAAMRDGPWKLVKPFVTRKTNPEDSAQQPVLYHLNDDPDEKQDVAKDHPRRYANMLEQLSRWSDSVERDRTRERTDEH